MLFLIWAHIFNQSTILFLCLPSADSSLRPEDRLLLSELFFSGSVPRVDMDWDTPRWRFVFGPKRVLNLDDFFNLGESVLPASSSSLSVSTWTTAEAESDSSSFFLPQTLSLILEIRERGLSVMERSNMLAVMLFRVNWISKRTSPLSLSAFPLLSASLYQLKTDKSGC